MNLPGGYSSRPATLDDIPDVVALRTAHDLAIEGRTEPHREFYSWFWRRPYVDPRRDSALVHEGDGALRGIAHVVWDPISGGESRSLVRVHPDRFGAGIGTALLLWTEEVAARRQAPPKEMHTTASSRDQAASQLFRSRGFEHIRNSWDMEMALSGSEQPVQPPRGNVIRPFMSGQDERTLHAVNEDTFAEHFAHHPQPFESFVADWYGADDFDPGLVWLAEEGGDVAGFVAAIEFESEGYIASIGVRKSWRGRGIATALLRQAFAELAARGFRLVSLSVDAGNETGAVDLYRKVGMSIRFETFIWAKELA